MMDRTGYNKPSPGYAQHDNTAYQQAQNKANAPQPVTKKEVQISQTTKEKADAAKEYIESKLPLKTHDLYQLREIFEA